MEMQYTSNGRMRYNPEYFGKTGQPWSSEDLEYLAGWYDVIGSEEMAFALERTPDSLMEKVRILRKRRVMTKPNKGTHKKRELSPKSPNKNIPMTL